MSKPILLYSDVHFHNWDAFSTVIDGKNSRLQSILDELGRAYDALFSMGGRTAYCGGDMFHVRGSVATSVLVPVLEFYRDQHSRGIQTHCIAGNHDLETNETTWAGNLVSALQSVGVTPVDEIQLYGNAWFVPWHSSVAELRQKLVELSGSVTDAAECDLIIHAPVNGVITGIPDTGLDPEWLKKLGFRRVFAGHYHNHVDFGGGVYSIGALTHQTWGDVGSKAGWMILKDEDARWYASEAPKFVDLNQTEVLNEEDLIEAVEGNYVRVSIDNPTQTQMNEYREDLRTKGAKGVLIRPINVTSITPGTRSTTAKLDSLDESVIDYADKKGGTALVAACRDILNTVRSAA